ncbi:alginate lyase family protein [Christiangramia sp. SM2212]|uniref:Alginate lyase family protein n=1 Tax=Christiangramia sediminicola TaxID=3073267 RepID=A0ABU1EMC9_9FLAO|nr:alginate lyase family protein [Christiangramia sp. SM2212]MDR5589343.1 alginate lyase family protein [Christiangramia sp. SM2212]
MNFSLYYHTLKHVKPIQLYYQVYYRLKNRFFKDSLSSCSLKSFPIHLKSLLLFKDSYKGNQSFEFLNLEKEFTDIDWNYNSYGKLWTYNLNYFDFLNQEHISEAAGLKLIKDFIEKGPDLMDGIEPYPISLRGINWIKFLSRYGITDSSIDSFLYRDYQRLSKNLEYHLLANHLLENGFSLLFGAYYFQDDNLYKKADKILKEELEEQILEDGTHFELSPMYHQIIFHRLLDSYNLVKNNRWKDQELILLLREKARLMFGWLESISFKNGEIPYLNDSTFGIAPTTSELTEYAVSLGLKPKKMRLGDSGYRKWNVNDMEIIMDVGQIAPSYQPGHSHADSLQFVLNYKDKPIVVDTGISTYEKNERRQLERSTASHNTVTINGENSSKVWGGFRVADRAKVVLVSDESKKIEAYHNGFTKQGVIHHRKFQFAEAQFSIEDKLVASNETYEATGHIHFHPDCDIELKESSIIINKEIEVHILGAEKLELMTYDFAEGFNQLKSARKIAYDFKHQVRINIQSIIGNNRTVHENYDLQTVFKAALNN